MLNRMKQLLTYQKAVRAGYIKETTQGGRSVWFIEKNAPKEVKDLAGDLAVLEIHFINAIQVVKVLSVVILLSIVLSQLGWI